LSAVVFVLSAVPLEIQRRIVNDAIKSGVTRTILWLAIAYAAVAVAQNGVKVVLNVYRGWVSERAVRRLRKKIAALVDPAADDIRSSQEAGVEVAMVLSEVEPIGGFVGISVSEPLLQGGILLSIIGYMIYLEPLTGLLSIAFLVPQFVFVPLLQAMVNRRAQQRIQVLRSVSTDMIESCSPAQSTATKVDQVFALNMGIFKIKYSMNFLMNLAYHFAVATALGVGGYFAVTGRLEVGSVVAIVAGLGRLNEPWGDLVNWWREMAVANVKYRLFVQAADNLANRFTEAGRELANVP
jgi:ABC-type multidrug transport system fused ATPase/permease subunit